MVGVTQLTIAGEHGGSEHGGKTHEEEHGGTVTEAPNDADIKAAMKSHVMASQKSSGTFDINDPDTGKVRKLTLVRVHERVGKTGDYYYSCADFKDTESDELLDLDIDVEDKNGTLSVVDVRIHKVSGNARYTYDSNDNRIPLKEGTKSHLGAAGEKGSVKGSAGKEHGGTEKASKEHGGTETGSKEHGG